MTKPPLIAVVGATATGKSDVAVALCEAFGGEVVGADAYQLYRGLDIGSAKVDVETRRRVAHHLIDVAEPDDPFTLARYLDAALAAVDGVWARGRLPVLCGGSGQYVWALIEGWQVPRVAPDAALRAELEALAASQGGQALVARLAALDLEAAGRMDPRNPRRLIRAIEVVSGTGLPLAACQTRRPIDADVLILGLRAPREEHYGRIDARVEAMFAAGLVDEVRRLRAAGYGETAAVRDGIGYREVSLHLDGEIDLAEALRRTQNAHHRLVRRQQAWFKADDARIRWIDAGEGAAEESIALVREWLSRR